MAASTTSVVGGPKCAQTGQLTHACNSPRNLGGIDPTLLGEAVLEPRLEQLAFRDCPLSGALEFTERELRQRLGWRSVRLLPDLHSSFDDAQPSVGSAEPVGRNLTGASITIVGGGGITQSLLRLLGPFRCDVTVVRQLRAELEGATRIVTPDDLDRAIAAADAVVLALALAPDTAGLIDRRRLDILGAHGWLVNVARGRHVVTDDLVAALQAGALGGAALDVTDPEPLPQGHPLWTFPNVLLTPHIGSTPEMSEPLLANRVTENLRRWAAQQPLLGLVDAAAGY